MQKAYQSILAVAGRILFIGFGIQVVLGLCWMVCNFGGLQKFGDSLLYEEISKTFICDEYEGILYPVLLMITRGIEEFSHIPYRFILYLLQTGFAFFVSYKMLECVGVTKRFQKMVGGLALLTFPMAMQCHLAVLPDSLVSSCLLLELAFCMRIFLQGEKVSSAEFVKVLSCWTVLSLFRPEYVIIGSIPVIILFLYGLVKTWRSDKRTILRNGVLMVSFFGMILMISDLTRVEGYYDRATPSLSSMLASRCVTFHAEEDYGNWPEEVKAHISLEQAQLVDGYVDNGERILAKTLEEAVGAERAQELLGELANIAWQRHRREIVHNTAWDVVGYTFSPLVVQRQFAGKAYDSYSGRNYDIMREKTPMLSAYFVDYSCWWFKAGLVITAVLGVLCFAMYLIKRGKKVPEIQPITWSGAILSMITCLVTMGVLIGIYSLRGAGMMDYKKSVAVTLLWIMIMLLAQNKVLNEESKEDEG